MIATPANTITLTLSLDIHAPQDVVWKALVSATNSWWPKDFLGGGAASKGLTLEAELGGRLVETWEGGGLIWYNVIALREGESLDLQGAITAEWHGPMVTMLKIALSSNEEEQTTLKLTDLMIGKVDEAFAQQIEEGWKAIFGGLKTYAEQHK